MRFDKSMLFHCQKNSFNRLKKNFLKKACFYPCKKILKFVKTPLPKFYGSILDGSGFYVLWFIITDQGLSVLQKKLNAFVSFLKELV